MDYDVLDNSWPLLNDQLRGHNSEQNGGNKELPEEVSFHVPVISVLDDDPYNSLQVSISRPANFEEINDLIEDIGSELPFFLYVELCVVLDERLLKQRDELALVFGLFQPWDQGDHVLQCGFAQDNALGVIKVDQTQVFLGGRLGLLRVQEHLKQE